MWSGSRRWPAVVAGSLMSQVMGETGRPLGPSGRDNPGILGRPGHRERHRRFVGNRGSRGAWRRRTAPLTPRRHFHLRTKQARGSDSGHLPLSLPTAAGFHGCPKIHRSWLAPVALMSSWASRSARRSAWACFCIWSAMNWKGGLVQPAVQPCRLIVGMITHLRCAIISPHSVVFWFKREWRDLAVDFHPGIWVATCARLPTLAT